MVEEYMCVRLDKLGGSVASLCLIVWSRVSGYKRDRVVGYRF